MPYQSLINWSNLTLMTDPSMIDIIGFANTTTGGNFWTAIGIYLIFFIVFFALLKEGYESALLVSSFIALFSSLILWYAGLARGTEVIIFGAGVILGVMFVNAKNQSTNK